MIPTKKQIENEIKALRRVVEQSDDPIESRIAYEIETALRWSIEDTVGWPRPHEEIKDAAHLLREKLKRTQPA